MADRSIIQIATSDPRWISFLESRTNTGIFHHPAWSQLMSECYGYRPFVIALPGGNADLTAGVPLMEVKNPITGTRWVSLPFSDYCRPLYKDGSAFRELANGMIQLATQTKILKLDLRGVYPDLPAFCVHSRHVIHEIDLGQGKEKVWKQTHQMHRRNIRIAHENDVEIIRGMTVEHLRDFYHLHLITRRRQGVPVQPWKFFERMKELLLDQELGFLLLAYKDRQCIAAAIFLHWKRTLTYKYGASRDDGLKYRPNNLLMWTAIQWGCDQGFLVFDLGRTDLENTGLRTFKSRWGAREIPLVYTSLSANSVQYGESVLLSYMHRILQRSPAWVCRLSGELLYKYFG